MAIPSKGKKTLFRVAYGLLVTPDIKDGATPYIDHRKIDFEALAILLKGVFTLNPGHVIAVANDSVDQVTLAARSGGLPGHRDTRDPGCADFGAALLEVVKSNTDAVIDVRDAWDGLHYMSDRYAEAPPPMLICFTVSSPEFHEAMQWANNANAMLGRDLMSEFFEEGEVDAMEPGILPNVLKEGLERIFGWPYESTGVLMRIASDKPPSYIS